MMDNRKRGRVDSTNEAVTSSIAITGPPAASSSTTCVICSPGSHEAYVTDAGAAEPTLILPNFSCQKLVREYTTQRQLCQRMSGKKVIVTTPVEISRREKEVLAETLLEGDGACAGLYLLSEPIAASFAGGNHSTCTIIDFGWTTLTCSYVEDAHTSRFVKTTVLGLSELRKAAKGVSYTTDAIACNSESVRGANDPPCPRCSCDVSISMPPPSAAREDCLLMEPKMQAHILNEMLCSGCGRGKVTVDTLLEKLPENILHEAIFPVGVGCLALPGFSSQLRSHLGGRLSTGASVLSVDPVYASRAVMLGASVYGLAVEEEDSLFVTSQQLDEEGPQLVHWRFPN